MYLDFKRICTECSQEGKKIPLIGIEPSGGGIRYVFGCGHGLIIQVVGAGSAELKKISDQLRKFQDKSLDELYEEMSKFESKFPQIAKISDKKEKGRMNFLEIKPIIQKIICDDFKLCEKLEYFRISIPAASGVVIADLLTDNLIGMPSSYVILVTSIVLHLPLLELKKWCNC